MNSLIKINFKLNIKFTNGAKTGSFITGLIPDIKLKIQLYFLKAFSSLAEKR